MGGGSRVAERGEGLAFPGAELLLLAHGGKVLLVGAGVVREVGAEQDDLPVDPRVPDAAGQIRELGVQVRDGALVGSGLGDELTCEVILAEGGEKRGDREVAAGLVEPALDDRAGDRVLDPLRVEVVDGPVEELGIRVAKELQEPEVVWSWPRRGLGIWAGWQRIRGIRFGVTRV